jgi:hypothetical protein
MRVVLGEHPKPAIDDHLKGSSALLVDDHGARCDCRAGNGSTRRRRRENPLRPYIWRFSSLSRCTCPSTGPLLP